MAEPSDTTLTFFTKATPSQWSYVLSMYKEVLKQKAALRTKKGGPEELIKLDAWYQEQLPKTIQARKDKHLVHEELVKIMKWKLMRGKYRPQLLDLVRINTELAVKSTSKKAFRKLPNLSGAITALTNLKGIGPATASAILAAAFPEQAPYMADESMLSTPGVEATDYTLAEYLNYAERIKTCTEQLAQKDPNGTWTPHKYKESVPSANGNGPSATTTSSDAAEDHHDVASNGAAEDAPLSSPSDSRSSADLAQVTNDESSSQDGPAENNGAVSTVEAGESAEDDSSSSAIIAADDAVVPDVTAGKGTKRDLEDEESAENDKKKARA
ncbi:hypothetical protein MRX96_013847 [Rhipicephalus microplus]